MLVVAHGNSLRALVKMLDNMREKAIIELNIPPACRCCMNWTRSSSRSASRYLGDQEAIKAAAEAVKQQASAKKP